MKQTVRLFLVALVAGAITLGGYKYFESSNTDSSHRKRIHPLFLHQQRIPTPIVQLPRVSILPMLPKEQFMPSCTLKTPLLADSLVILWSISMVVDNQKQWLEPEVV
jgi:hypothetical protein